MASTTARKDLLNLENKISATSSLVSTLLVCPKKESQTLKHSTCGEKLVTVPVPKSQVLGKLKDFLGVMAEANKKLEHDIKENSSKNYDIEALTGKENEYIEMDLVLGVADLHTPEAVAAAESAIIGSKQVIPLSCSNSWYESESSEDEDDECDALKASERISSNETKQPKKQSKILELN